MTPRDIINEVLNNNVELSSKIVDDALGKMETAAAERVNGKIDNNGYKQQIEKIRKDLEQKKREAFLIDRLKNRNQGVQGGQVGSDSVGAGVSAPVQNKV